MRQRSLFIKQPINNTLFNMLSQQLSDIYIKLHNLLQKRYKQPQYIIVHIIIPRLYPYAVQGCCVIEVFSQIIYDNGSGHVTPQIFEVFDCVVLMWCCVLSIQPVRYLVVAIDVIQNIVSILKQKHKRLDKVKNVYNTYIRHGCSEDNYFKVLTELTQEPQCPRSYIIIARLV